MSGPLRPEVDPRVAANVQKMRAGGASDAEIAEYLSEYEGASAPTRPAAMPGFAAESTAQQPRPANASRGSAPTAAASGRRGNVFGAIGQGASLGFGDEVGGVIGALFQGDSYRSPSNFAANYRSSRDDVRQQDKAYASDHPVKSGVAELLGSIMPVLATGGAAPGAARVAPGVLRGAAEGAAFGGAIGAGNAEGGVGDRIGGAVAGGTTGAAFGGALPLVAKGARALGNVTGLHPFAGRTTLAAVPDTPPSAVAAALPDAAPVPPQIPPRGDPLRLPVPEARALPVPIPARGEPARLPIPAAQPTPEPTSVQNIALDRLLGTLRDDNTTLSSLGRVARTEAARPGAKPRTILDLAGDNTRGLARAAQATPSRARDQLQRTLTDRQEGQLGRIAGDLESAVGTGQRDVYQVADDLIQQRSAAAAPAYDAYFSGPPVQSEKIQALMERPSMKKALARARSLAAEEGTALPEVSPEAAAMLNQPGMREGLARAQALAAQEGRTLPDVGAASGGAPSDRRTLHFVKLALDDMLDAGKRGGTSLDDSGGLGKTGLRSITETRRAFLDALDEAAPEYAEARAAFAGPSAMLDALEDGRSILKDDARLSAAAIAKLGDGEKEMFRAGAMDAIGKAMRDAPDQADLTRKLFSSPERRAQLRALFPDDRSWQRFRSNVTREAKMARTKDFVLGGSPTARIQSDLANMAGANIGELAATAGQAVANPGGAAINFALRRLADAGQRRAQGVVGNVASDLSGVMTLPTNDPRFRALVEALAARSQQEAARAGVQRQASRAAGALGGGLVPQP